MPNTGLPTPIFSESKQQKARLTPGRLFLNTMGDYIALGLGFHPFNKRIDIFAPVSIVAQVVADNNDIKIKTLLDLVDHFGA